MKTKSITLIILTVFLLIFSSCSKDDGLINDSKVETNDEVKELTLNTNKLNIKKGNHEHLQITGGNGDYKVTTSNDNITAEVEGNEIHVDAIKLGTSTITVTDAKGKIAKIEISVTGKGDDVAISGLDVVHKIEVVITQGHMHDNSTGGYFHGNKKNASPLRIKQYFVLEKGTNGNWVRVQKDGDEDYLNEGKPVAVKGYDVKDKAWSFRYAYEFKYYDIDGNRLEDTFVKDKDIYQTLFSIEEYKVLKTNEIVKLNSTKEFFDYTYRDTNYPTKMYGDGGVVTDNYMGFKGHSLTNKNKVSYTLKVNFVKYEKSTSKVNSIYFEEANTNEISDQISFEIPVIIPTGKDADDEWDVWVDYFGLVSVNEYEKLLYTYPDGPGDNSKYFM